VEDILGHNLEKEGLVVSIAVVGAEDIAVVGELHIVPAAEAHRIDLVVGIVEEEEHHIVPVEGELRIDLEEGIVVEEGHRMEAVDSLAVHSLEVGVVDRSLAEDSLEAADRMEVVQEVRRMVVGLEEGKENDLAAERHIHSLVVDMPS
jgi:hypothetical protein